MSPKIRYVRKKFNPTSVAVIGWANRIIDEYTAQGFRLTLRQLYYQFVSRDLLGNKVSEYKRLGSIINDARLAGEIDWYAIEDRTRNLQGLPHWDDPASIMSGAASGYAIDKWASQPVRIEVWIEKEALAGVFEGVCNELDIPFFSCRGYTSQSEMWGAAMRLRAYARSGQTPHILHFGDHDPSGIDMTRDIQDRMSMFGCRLDLARIALNMDQVEQYQPPPNPAKETDSRFRGYIEKFGDESWELDALEPRVLADLVRDRVHGLRNAEEWDAAELREAKEKELLAKVAHNWNEVEEFLEGL